MKILLLFTLFLNGWEASALPLLQQPEVPQICRIAYAVRGQDGLFMKLGTCDGTLVGADGAQESTALLTAASCEPQKIAADFKAKLDNLNRDEKSAWDARMRDGELALQITCGPSQLEITQPKAIVAKSEDTDLAMIPLDEPLAIPPMRVGSINSIAEKNRNCMTTVTNQSSGKFEFYSYNPPKRSRALPSQATAIRGSVDRPLDLGGPVLCITLAEDEMQIVGLNSLRAGTLFQHFTPEVLQWLVNEIENAK